MKHKFGGPWTRKKLEVLEDYLGFYAKALKNQPFVLHYADAYAGTGSHVPIDDDAQALLVPFDDFNGSVLTALSVEPGFHQYHFNDLNRNHVAELERIREEHPQKQIHIHMQDANQFVPEFCRRLSRNDRAVLLLDPYSTQLDWDTLKHIASSGKVDLWLLFPISVILRMTPTDEERVKPEWKNTLNRLLGTDEWESALYKPVEAPRMDDLFGDVDATPAGQRVNTDELGQWVTGRLNELFPYVAKPVLLKNHGRPLFLFYFAVSNPNSAAWRLADKAASHIIKKHQQ
ncbi:MAG: three-Cys-motif partner protein TcmP [Pseudohongiella sp.]|nr:three-Cys-motif partner protein TcmP [Pseudohongiella sp.]